MIRQQNYSSGRLSRKFGVLMCSPRSSLYCKQMQKVQREVDDQIVINCPHRNHEGSPLQFVCIDNNCCNRELLCEECAQDCHYGHSKMPIREFLKQRKSFKDLDESANKYIDEIIKCQKTCLDTIDKFREQIDDILLDFKNRVKVHFEEIIESLKQNIKSTEKETGPTFKINEEPNPERIIQKIKKELYIYYTNQQCHDLLQSQSVNSMAKQQQLQVQMSEATELILAQTKSAIQKISNIFDVSSGNSPKTIKKISQARPLQWSSELKHPDIELQNNWCKRMKDSGVGYVCILGDMQLDDREAFNFTWAVKIHQNANWLGIGICLEREAQKRKFAGGNLDCEGHGNYMLGSGGYAYSTSDMAINGKDIGFEFTAGDIIELMYTTTNMRLQLRKNYSDIYEFCVKAPPKGDFYRPCVYFLGVGDSAELTKG